MPARRRVVAGAAPASGDDPSLPRPPGVLRRFWARHPRTTDVLIATLAFVLSAPAAFLSARVAEDAVPSAAWVAAGVTTVACAALVLRRGHPLPVFAVAVAPSILLPIDLAPITHIVIGFSIYAVAVYRSARACWIAFGVASVGLVTAGAVALWTDPGRLAPVIGTATSGILTLLVAALIGVNIAGRRGYLDALIDRSRRLAVERDQQAQLATAAERDRIAREMHDIVSHSLTVVVALSEGAMAATTPAHAREASRAAAETARGALDEMRAMLGVLRDGDGTSPLQPIEPADPVEIVATAQRAGFPVVSEITGSSAALPRPTRFAVGRVVQESVTNAMRHAPRASSILVRVRTAADVVEIDVRNDGVHAVAPSTGFGLRGIRERVASGGGSLEAGPDGQNGWRVRAVIPVPHTAEVPA